MGMEDRITVVSAIGHHDESTGNVYEPHKMWYTPLSAARNRSCTSM